MAASIPTRAPERLAGENQSLSDDCPAALTAPSPAEATRRTEEQGSASKFDEATTLQPKLPARSQGAAVAQQTK